MSSTLGSAPPAPRAVSAEPAVSEAPAPPAHGLPAAVVAVDFTLY